MVSLIPLERQTNVKAVSHSMIKSSTRLGTLHMPIITVFSFHRGGGGGGEGQTISYTLSEMCFKSSSILPEHMTVVYDHQEGIFTD